MAVFQFVDSIASGPTVRLDLNDGMLRVRSDGLDLSPPPLRRATASTLLEDGERIPAAAWGNRTVVLPLQLVASTTDDGAAKLQHLARELCRERNILRVQLDGAAAPVFFRTYAAPDYAWDMPRRLLEIGRATLEIPAEPFAYGLKETLPQVTVSNDPAAVSNGCFWDVTGIKGDVETPLVMRRPVANRGDQSLIAVRRRGTPSNLPFFLQAEALTAGPDTSAQPNSGVFSGAGNNFVRCTFGTTAGWAARVSVTAWPASASVDARGTYRVFAKVRKNGATGTVQVRLSVFSLGALPLADPVTVTATSPAMVDLGLLSVPGGMDPVADGVSGTLLPARGLSLDLEAQRTSGTDTLDIDYLMFVPADDRMCVTQWTTNGVGADAAVIDGANEVIYGTVVATGEVVTQIPWGLVGGFPLVSPGVTNRIYYLNEVKPGDPEPVFPGTTTWDCAYWPRYLNVRPGAS